MLIVFLFLDAFLDNDDFRFSFFLCRKSSLIFILCSITFWGGIVISNLLSLSTPSLSCTTTIGFFCIRCLYFRFWIQNPTIWKPSLISTLLVFALFKSRPLVFKNASIRDLASSSLSHVGAIITKSSAYPQLPLPSHLKRYYITSVK